MHALVWHKCGAEAARVEPVERPGGRCQAVKTLGLADAQCFRVTYRSQLLYHTCNLMNAKLKAKVDRGRFWERWGRPDLRSPR